MSDYITSTNNLKITELDFDAIKSALKTYLQGQEEFKDYNFDGSAMSILLDVLAYNTHYNGFYTNMLASEMFIDSATLRSSIVSLAKHLGYTPFSRQGASVFLTLVIESSASSITIPKNTKFTTQIGTDQYTFLATKAHAAKYYAPNNNYVAEGIEVKEGVLAATSYTVLGTINEIFQIPNENVDISTLKVAVAGEYYTKVDDITEVTSTSKVYFVQEGNQNKYEIYFGDGIIGKKPSNGDQVTLTYNVSLLGSEGNGATVFSLADTIVGADSTSVSLSSGHIRSTGGTERETTSSIRIQAPRQFGLQKRVVTKNDYKTRLENDYSLVDSVRVWGGEENNPPDYGRVYICVKPKTGYVLSKAEETRIAENILKKRNMVTVRPKFVEPDYLFVIPDISVAYDPRRTVRTPEQLKILIKANIINYNSQNLSKFDQYFRYSVISRLVDDTEVSIMNNNMIVAMKKRFKPINRVSGQFRLRFDNPIHRPHRGHMRVLQSTLFKYGNLENCAIVDKDGILMVVHLGGKEGTSSLIRSQLTPTSTGSGLTGVFGYTTKEYNVINDNVGEVDYETGEVVIGHGSSGFKSMSINDGSDYIYLTAKPRIQDIISRENTIITIEPDDITINWVDDTTRVLENKVRGY